MDREAKGRRVLEQEQTWKEKLCEEWSPSCFLSISQFTALTRSPRITNDWVGTVCSNGWDIKEAEVVCRILNFTSATSAPTAVTFGGGKGPIWFDDVNCNGNENSIPRITNDWVARVFSFERMMSCHVNLVFSIFPRPLQERGTLFPTQHAPPSKFRLSSIWKCTLLIFPRVLLFHKLILVCWFLVLCWKHRFYFIGVIDLM